MNASDDDRPRFWSTVYTLKAVEQAKSMTDQPISVDADSLRRALTGAPWQLNAAFRLQPTWATLIDRGSVYLKMKRLRKAITDECDGAKQRAGVKKLTRMLGLLEFGVAVNEQWFRKLDSLVADGVITQAELKKILRSVEVTWDKDGELVIQKFHLVTRSMISVALTLFMLFSFVILSLAIQTFQEIGLDSAVGWVFVYYFLGSFWPTWCIWWIGPRSWSSSSKLQKILRKHVDPWNARSAIDG